jgi:hypothetical protein
MGRMNFLIVLGTLLLKVPLGILKNVEFYKGLMPVFCTEFANDITWTAVKKFNKTG